MQSKNMNIGTNQTRTATVHCMPTAETHRNTPLKSDKCGLITATSSQDLHRRCNRPWPSRYKHTSYTPQQTIHPPSHKWTNFQPLQVSTHCVTCNIMLQHAKHGQSSSKSYKNNSSTLTRQLQRCAKFNTDSLDQPKITHAYLPLVTDVKVHPLICNIAQLQLLQCSLVFVFIH